jgi:hypothetical protein
MPSLTTAPTATMITIDKPRAIRYTFSAACRFEEKFGSTIPNALQNEVGSRLISHLAWAGMLHSEPTLRVQEVEKRLQAFLTRQDGDINDLAQELLKALVASGVLGKQAQEDQEEEEFAGDPQEPQE